jgi:hypothetical protein
MKLRALCIGLTVLSLGAVGCDQGRQAPAKTTVQVVHAAPGFAGISFLREQRNEADLTYKSSSVLSFDEDQYDFNLYTVPAGSSTRSLERSFSQQVLAGTRYTFVLAEVGGLLEPVILEAPEVDDTATTAQVHAFHAAGTVPAVDVFLEPAGTDLGTATPLGSLSFLQGAAPTTRDAGDYEVTVTEAGNPAAVLLASTALTLSAATSQALVIVDGANEGTAPLAVTVVGNSSAVLIDKNLEAGMRVVNAAADMAARDVAVGGQFSPPRYSAVPFATLSSYEALAVGDSTINVTPAGNPGAIEVESTVSAAGGRLYTLLVTGEPGALAATSLPDDRRPIGDRARVGLLNGATQFEQLNFYIVPPGTDTSTVNAVTTLNAGNGVQYAELTPGDYDLVLRDVETEAIVAGPQTVTLTAAGVFGMLAIDGADAATAAIVLYDDF